MTVEVSGLTKAYQGRLVVRQVSFSIAAGELLVLLGPSGSGKSTVLRMIGGLTPCDAGSIRVDGVDVTDLRPQARDMGFVFQSYALFEHMSVADNVEFALRVRKLGKAERERRRSELLAMVGLDGMSKRLPGQLSGGQRQRAALARALAHQPQLLLLDEPFGALDARIRHELRNSLRLLLKRLGTTAIFVTHDQEEAFALADRILVMHRGRVLEEGLPAELYRHPRTEFVAEFLGRANLLPPGVLRAPLAAVTSAPDHNPRVKALLRPEDIALSAHAPATSAGRWSLGAGKVERSEFLGASERIWLRLQAPAAQAGESELVEVERGATQISELPLSAGDEAHLTAQRVHWVPHPSLRILLLADADARGRALVEQALAFGEHSGALMTVLGGIASDRKLRARIDIHRQQFAGDLRLIDPADSEQSTLDAALRLTRSERFDLAIYALGSGNGGWRVLLAEGGVQALLLPSTSPAARWPLAAGERALWVLHHEGTRLQLGAPQLLNELAEAAAAAIARQPEGERGTAPLRHDLLVRCLSAPLDRDHPHLLAGEQQAARDDAFGQLFVVESEDLGLRGDPGRIGSGRGGQRLTAVPELLRTLA